MGLRQGLRPTKADAALWVFISLIGGWLIWSVIQVNIEFDDGYATLVNSSYFLGKQSEVYFVQRGPFMAFFLMPGQLLKDALGMHPMDVRLAHAQMAFLHFLYFIGTWALLVRVHGRDRHTLLAFVAAMATPVFFSYASFISHDIFPGLLALWMVYLAHRYLATPSPWVWLSLVCLGVTLPLIKQTFALVWFALAVSVPLLLIVQRADRRQWHIARGLLYAAAISGAITWLAYGAILQVRLGEEPLWLRPWLQITLITSNYASEGGAWNAFYPWIYVQNLWAYGILAMLLLLPGLVLALSRGSSFERLVALFWLFMVLMLHVTPYKEVRYLVVLAPFNAVLLVPVLRQIWQGSILYRWFVWLLFALGLVLAVDEALRIRAPYYSRAVLDFLEPLQSRDRFTGRVIMGRSLNFVSPENQAYMGDRYHRITHLLLPPIIAAYGYKNHQYLQVKDVGDVTAQLVRPGDVWLMSNGIVGRIKPFVRGNRQGLQKGFVQTFAVAETVTLMKQAGGYRISGPNAWAPYHFLADSSLEIVVGHISDALAAALFARDEMPESAEVVAFRVLRYCTLQGCAAMGQDEAAALATELAKPAIQ